MKRASRTAALALFCALAVLQNVVSASAQDNSGRAIDGNAMSSEELLRALTPKPASSAAQPSRGELTRSFGSRSLKPHNPHKVRSEKVFLNVNFELNSAVLGADAKQQLAELAETLNDPALNGQSFGLSGHTDASGLDRYNMDLSKRRADAVRDFLQSEFGVDISRLFTNGLGETQPLDGARPLAAENRRVEIFNLANVQD